MKKTYTPERIKYINKKIVESNRKRILEERKLSWARLAFCASILFSIVGISGLTVGNPIGIGILALSIEVGCFSYIENKKYLEQANKFIEENYHLHKIKFSCKKDEDSNKERINKLIKLYSDRKQTERKLDDAKTIEWLSYIVTTIGVGSVFINPATMWLPIVGIVGNVLAGVNKLQKVRKNEEIISQTINVENEIDLIRHLELKKEEEKEIEQLRQETINKIDNFFKENGVVFEEIPREEMAFINGVINSINELEEEYQDVPKTYYKSKDGK